MVSLAPSLQHTAWICDHTESTPPASSGQTIKAHPDSPIPFQVSLCEKVAPPASVAEEGTLSSCQKGVTARIYRQRMKWSTVDTVAGMAASW